MKRALASVCEAWRRRTRRTLSRAGESSQHRFESSAIGYSTRLEAIAAVDPKWPSGWSLTCSLYWSLVGDVTGELLASYGSTSRKGLT